MKCGTTKRGFSMVHFKDRYDHVCSLQKSSIATEPCLWLGPEDADPEIMAKDTPEGGSGWKKFEIPEEVSLYTRMHLTQKQVLRLLPNLIKFVLTGNI